jgi:ABC-2 type transport system ATP-binding protein
LIRTHQLTRQFGATTAVDSLDLDLDQQGIVGFLGPNGAGKTTTMRMLTGFLPQTSGDAVVCGFDVFEQPLEVKARVGYLPERPPLYDGVNVGEYLRFVAEIRGIPSATRLVRVGEAMEQVGLTGWENRLLGTLSKGFRQRVGLAQAIVHRPSLLILDEPTSGLDPAQLVKVRGLIRRLAVDRLVVLSTHILAEVELLCDRILMIHRGRLVGDGTVATLAAAAGAGPWVELHLVQTVDQTAALATLDAVHTVSRIEAGRYRVTGSAELAGVLATWAGQRNLDLVGISPRQASLERVFLDLVGTGV